MDARSLELLRLLYPDIRPRVFKLREDVYTVTGRYIRLTRSFATFAEQDAIYAKGRTLPGPIVTNAKPGLSLHNYGLAFDVCFIGEDPFLESLAKTGGSQKAEDIWEQVAKCGEGNGLEAGRRFRSRPDSPHFQLSYGLDLHEIIEIYRVGGLAGVWTQCDKILGFQSPCGWVESALPLKEVMLFA